MPRIELIIPRVECATIPELLNAISVRMQERMPELDHDIFMVGPENGLSFSVIREVGGLPPNALLVFVDYDARYPNPPTI